MTKLKTKIVGLSGAGTCGKDSCFLIINEFLASKNINSERVALADPLKYELNEFTKKQYGISSFTIKKEEKEIIRPLMVCHGKIKRQLTNGKYFTSIAQGKVDENNRNGAITFITDIRYSAYSEDELQWLRKNDGVLVFIERFDSDGQIIPPANDDEKENNIKLKKSADYQLKWITTPDLSVRKDCVYTQLSELIHKLEYENK